MNSLQQDWLSNVRNDLLAGLAVALALIPEAIAFGCGSFVTTLPDQESCG